MHAKWKNKKGIWVQGVIENVLGKKEKNIPQQMHRSHWLQCLGGNAPRWRPSPTCCWDRWQKPRTAASQVHNLGKPPPGHMFKHHRRAITFSCEGCAEHWDQHSGRTDSVPHVVRKAAPYRLPSWASSEAQSAPSERFSLPQNNLWTTETLCRHNHGPECQHWTLCKTTRGFPEDYVDLKANITPMPKGRDTVKCKWCQDIFKKKLVRGDVSYFAASSLNTNANENW